MIFRFNNKERTEIVTTSSLEFTLIIMLLLPNANANQSPFALFLFHTKQVAVAIDFTREKKMFPTGYAHPKRPLWKSCGLGFLRHIRKKRDKTRPANTDNPDRAARQAYFRTMIAAYPPSQSICRAPLLTNRFLARCLRRREGCAHRTIAFWPGSNRIGQSIQNKDK